MAPQHADQQGVHLGQHARLGPACQPPPQGRAARLSRCRGQAAPGCALTQEAPQGPQHPDGLGGRVAASSPPGRSAGLITVAIRRKILTSKAVSPMSGTPDMGIAIAARSRPTGPPQGPDEVPMPITIELSHRHRFVPATASGKPPILLLHGTGGDENDLLPLGQTIAPGAALLSPRGKVLEGGMPRFFRRLAEGVFDEHDVRRRANELADFVLEALGRRLRAGRSDCGRVLQRRQIGAAVLQLRPEVLAGAVLLRAMVPLSDAPVRELDDKPVLILSGTADPIGAGRERRPACVHPQGCRSHCRSPHLPAGHGLSQADVALTKTWLDQR